MSESRTTPRKAKARLELNDSKVPCRECGARWFIGAAEGSSVAKMFTCGDCLEGRTPLKKRIEALEGHRTQWRRVAFSMLDLIESLGAMDVHDTAGHTGRYVCSWCDGESPKLGAVTPKEAAAAVVHSADCRLAATLARFKETEQQT